ncbi:MAG: DUF4258 domain-containing protein [Hyphomicrobiales bacterium]|nr:DUF4258 domain-containing protein [Hyphomicrobiales bacterium]
MKETFDIVRVFARQGRVLISDHADDRMNERNIAYSEVVAGVEAGVPIEEYLTDERGARNRVPVG